MGLVSCSYYVATLKANNLLIHYDELILYEQPLQMNRMYELIRLSGYETVR